VELNDYTGQTAVMRDRAHPGKCVDQASVHTGHAVHTVPINPYFSAHSSPNHLDLSLSPSLVVPLSIL